MAMHPLGRVSAVSAPAAPVSATAWRQDAEEQLVYVGDARHGGVLVAHADLARAKQQLRGEVFERLGLQRDRTNVRVPASAFFLDKWIELPRTERCNASPGRWVPYANGYTEALEVVTADPFGVWRLRCDTSRLALD